MTAQLDLSRAQCIVEYGPGTGVLTQELATRKPRHTQLLVIEANARFANHLAIRYAHREDIHVLHDSAENVGKVLEKVGLSQADRIVSGLPFSTLPPKVTDRILEATHTHLSPEGRFVLFQYSKLKTAHFERYFRRVGIEHVLWNVPPAFIMAYQHAM